MGTVTERLPHRPGRPVVVAINATGACGETLETAALLAATEGVQLEVVFVENANLLRLADLPITREIDRISGAVRDMDSGRMLRALEVETRRLRQEIARIERVRAVRSTLRIARGEILSEALSASAQVDVTFVHAATRAWPGERLAVPGPAFRSTPPAGIASRGARRKPVWTLFEGGPRDARTLETAAKLAGTLECGLVVLIPYRDTDEAERHAREARALGGNVDIRLLDVSGDRSPFEPGMLEPRTSRLLVMAKQSPSFEDAAARRYLESLPVPLVLV